MGLDVIKNSISAVWSKIAHPEIANNLLQAIKEENIEKVTGLLKQDDFNHLISDEMVGIRQIIVFEAILSDGDNRQILDALFSNNNFKEVIKEVAFHGAMHLLYKVSYDNVNSQPKVNKLASIIDNFAGGIKFSTDAYNNDVKLDSDFVVMGILRPAILAGVPIKTIQVVFDNPTFSSCGIVKGHINYLAELATITSDMMPFKDSTVIEDVTNQSELLKVISNVYENLFQEKPGFEDERFDEAKVEVDYTLPDNINLLNITSIPIIVQSSTELFNQGAKIANSTMDALKGQAGNQTIGIVNDATGVKGNKAISDYINDFRKLNPVKELSGIFIEVYNNLKSREYNKNIMESIGGNLSSLDENQRDVFLVTSSVYRLIDIDKRKKLISEYMYPDSYINEKLKQGCVVGEVEYKGKMLPARVDITFNSAPELKWQAVASLEKEKEYCDVYAAQPHGPIPNAVNNYFDYAVQYTSTLHPEQFDSIFNH